MSEDTNVAEKTVEEESLGLLEEFVDDVERVGVSRVEEDWFDLHQTYLKARGLLDRLRRREPPLVVGGHTVPRGNARVGDGVLWRESESGDWQDGWKVVELGIMNEHEYPLDVIIQYDSYTHQVSPCQTSRVLILPPEDSLPARLREYLGEQPDLFAVRDVANRDEFVYALYCRACMAPLSVGRVSGGEEGEAESISETAVLLFAEGAGGGFYRGSAVPDDAAEEGVGCQCGDKFYEEPHDYAE